MSWGGARAQIEPCSFLDSVYPSFNAIISLGRLSALDTDVFHSLWTSGVAAYVGWQSSSILKPLLQQGLSDAEEFVIYKALNALTCMCQLGLLQKPHIHEFACDIGKLIFWKQLFYFIFPLCTVCGFTAKSI